MNEDQLPPGVNLVDPTQGDVRLHGFGETIQRGLERDQLKQSPEELGPGLVEQIDQRIAQRQAAQPAGAGVTAFSQFGRGVIDAILAPGALVGMASEGLGEATGSHWLRDFGRDLGEASSGKGYLEAYAFVLGGGFGDDKSKALTEAERVKTQLDKQEQDWPMLSMLSRIAGQASVAVAAGAGSAGAVGAKTLAGVAAYEGAAGGAQAAYEDQAPLVDVLSSSLLGATIGGAAGYAGGRVAEHFAAKVPKMSDLGQALGAEVKRGARNAYVTVDEVGGIQAKKVIDRIMSAKDAITKRIRAAGPQQTAREAAEASARKEIGEQISAKVSDELGSWAVKEPDALTKFVKRPQYLDRISSELAQDFDNVARVRPSVDFDMSADAARKLVKDADGAVAINGLQERIGSVLRTMPDTEETAQFAVQARDAMAKIARVGRPGKGTASRVTRKAYEKATAEAMTEGHKLTRAVQALTGSPDEMVRQFAQNARGQLVDQLSSDAFGSAGAVYRRAHVVADPSNPLEAFTDQRTLREGLRSIQVQGELFQEVEKRNQQWLQAFDAQRKLGGSAPKEATQSLQNLSKRVAAAERVLTLDGKSTGRVMDYIGGKAANAISDKLVKIVGSGVGGLAGGAPGMALGYMVSNVVAPYIKRAMTPIAERALMSAVRGASNLSLPRVAVGGGTAISSLAHSAGRAVRTSRSAVPLVTRSERQERYHERIDKLAEFDPASASEAATQGLIYFHEVGPDTTGAVAAAMNARVEQLMKDIPKPKPHLGGKAYEVLSTQDLERSEAMWDATFDPMGMFDDFERGTVNYDRIEYTWKQYPGLQAAVQAGIVDSMFEQLSDDQRVGIPTNMVTQLDFLGGFKGQLHVDNDPGFSQAVKESFAKLQESNKPGGGRPGPPPVSKSPIAEHQRTYVAKVMR